MGNPHTERSRKHNEAMLDRLEITVPKGQKAIIVAAATAAGMSMNAYIKEAIQEKMGKDHLRE